MNSLFETFMLSVVLVVVFFSFLICFCFNKFMWLHRISLLFLVFISFAYSFTCVFVQVLLFICVMVRTVSIDSVWFLAQFMTFGQANKMWNKIKSNLYSLLQFTTIQLCEWVFMACALRECTYHFTYAEECTNRICRCCQLPGVFFIASFKLLCMFYCAPSHCYHQFSSFN